MYHFVAVIALDICNVFSLVVGLVEVRFLSSIVVSVVVLEVASGLALVPGLRTIVWSVSVVPSMWWSIWLLISGFRLAISRIASFLSIFVVFHRKFNNCIPMHVEIDVGCNQC